MKYDTKEKFEKVNVFGTGAPNDAYAQFFIGESFLNPLTDFQKGEFPLFNVTFEPVSDEDYSKLDRGDKGHEI